LRKTLAMARLDLLVALVTTSLAACSSSDKAGIVLNVTTAPGVDRSAILALQVTVNGLAQSYGVGTALTWSLGIKTSAGSKSITVSAMTASVVTAQWQGIVEAEAGRVVTRDVELQAIGAMPLDGGNGPGMDGAIGDGPTGSGGAAGRDGAIASGGGGGRPGMGGASGFSGTTGGGSGAAPGTGGLPGLGGRRTGGAPGTGGGMAGAGGLSASGGRTASGGTSTGGTTGTGGITMSGGTRATGGTLASGGTTGTGGTAVACSVGPPLSGGTPHCATTGTGKVGSYTWNIWSSGGGGCLTTYSDAGCAFSASWNNSGDFLARCGLQWDATRTHDQLGTISAEFAEARNGSASGPSYIGVYGWSNNPCVEFYIVEDSFDRMPVNPGNTTNKGTVDIDGGQYVLYTRTMTVTGGSRCPGVSTFMQYFSVRTTARACGTIPVSKHFAAWAEAGMPLGKMYEATILVEAEGGTGSIDFTKGTIVLGGGVP
jgi:endo-1,4-beta-xylanase